ncbi:GWxTD domain-containing protein [bacterium]|nr:GWxTD domain-containing protein [bacterium]
MRRRMVLSTVILIVLLANLVNAQPVMMRQYREIGLPRFDVNAISLLSDQPERTRVIAYIELPYENLQFVRSSRGYEANYEVDMSILAGPTDSSPRVENKIWRSTVIVPTFEETNSRELFDISETTIILDPANYTMIATVTDLETRKQFQVSRTLMVPSYDLGGLSMGDLLLAREVVKTPSGAFEIVPNVDRVIAGEDEELYVYYEVYPTVSDTMHVHSRVLDRNGSLVFEQRRTVDVEKPVTRDYFEIPTAKLGVGSHVVEMQVRTEDFSTLKAAEFQVRLTGLPSTVQNMETAIRQLRYVARNREVERMLNASSHERQILFHDFWKKMDPSPDTPPNELMEEYYNRIHEASAAFGGMRDGWETDRGEVYVRYGPPDEVERHPFEVDSRPYEIWYYYDGQKRFVFVDELGYGEYRLVSNLWQ